jgi:hypothetical protein
LTGTYTQDEVDNLLRLEKENCINEKEELVNRIKETVEQKH